jgi:hypothetical protein
VVSRETRARAWEDAAARAADAAVAKAGVETRIADHHRSAAEMFDAMAAALERRAPT